MDLNFTHGYSEIICQILPNLIRQCCLTWSTNLLNLAFTYPLTLKRISWTSDKMHPDYTSSINYGRKDPMLNHLWHENKTCTFKLFLRICWILPKKYLLLLDQTILLHFRSSIDRPLNLPQYPGSNNYFSTPEENI